jgi:hypothetical protein
LMRLAIGVSPPVLGAWLGQDSIPGRPPAKGAAHAAVACADRAFVTIRIVSNDVVTSQ